ncbi:MAG TPA: prepilin-type N-terminal cleavage/methylation domain-containing protein [Gemmatimonadales bacterium]|nr:prepilin-type N-terminal cleavage/methylation domain-containing protein [Gemmatimonadales bacterium]
MTRRGFSLIEMVVVVTIIGFLVLGTGFTLAAAARTTRTAVEGLGHARDLTTTLALLRVSTMGADSADLTVGIRDTLDFDRRVGEGAPCASGGGVVVMADLSGGFERPPEAGRDQLLILTALEPAIWDRRPLLGVATSRCPDLTPALALTTAPGAPALWLRIVTPVRLRAYRSGGATWLGLEDRGGPATLQPFAGPITRSLRATILPGRLRVGIGGDAPPITIPLGVPR